MVTLSQTNRSTCILIRAFIISIIHTIIISYLLKFYQLLYIFYFSYYKIFFHMKRIFLSLTGGPADPRRLCLRHHWQGRSWDSAIRAAERRIFSNSSGSNRAKSSGWRYSYLSLSNECLTECQETNEIWWSESKPNITLIFVLLMSCLIRCS